jgi:hypothetical protein
MYPACLDCLTRGARRDVPTRHVIGAMEESRLTILLSFFSDGHGLKS